MATDQYSLPWMYRGRFFTRSVNQPNSLTLAIYRIGWSKIYYGFHIFIIESSSFRDWHRGWNGYDFLIIMTTTGWRTMRNCNKISDQLMEHKRSLEVDLIFSLRWMLVVITLQIWLEVGTFVRKPDQNDLDSDRSSRFSHSKFGLNTNRFPKMQFLSNDLTLYGTWSVFIRIFASHDPRSDENASMHLSGICL